MRDHQDRTDERSRPLPGDRPVAGMPVTGAGRGPATDPTDAADREDDRIILSSRTEDETRDATEPGRDDTPASQTVEPGGPAGPLGERTAGPAATARSYAPGGSSAGSTGSVMAPDAGTTPDSEDESDAARTDRAGASGERPAAGSPGVAVASDGPGPARIAGGSRLLGRDDADRFESRWRELKAGFVDDPRGSVERASALCEEAVTALTTALEERRGSLKERWDGDADTERLRTALRAYGVLLERLASV